jgi:hypothetical protein
MAYTPNPDRKVKDGKAMVSAKELADFKSQYGEDKSLRDLLNADKGLRRRGEDSAPSKTDAAALAAKGQAGNEAMKKEEEASVKEVAPVKEAAPAKEAAPKSKVSTNFAPGATDEEKVANRAAIGDAVMSIPRGIGSYLNKTFSMEGREQAKKEAKQSFKKGGSVSASSRGDGIAQRGKTRGKMC